MFDVIMFLAIAGLLILLANGCYQLGVEDGYAEARDIAILAQRVRALATEDRPATQDGEPATDAPWHTRRHYNRRAVSTRDGEPPYSLL